MGIYDRDHRQNDPWKKTPPGVKQYKISDFKNINTKNKMQHDGNKAKKTASIITIYGKICK